MNDERELGKIQREISIRKIMIIIFLIILIIAIIIFVSKYIAEESFRKWVDVNILKKDIGTEDVVSIDLKTDKNNQIYCYSKYICILNDKNLKLYDSSGINVTDISIDINTALFASNGNYLAVAEKNGQEICVILDKTFMWKQKLDGEILQISMNRNGYVAIITTDTTYKSIITVYDFNGKQLLKNYLSTTRVVDVTISNDNKYVAFAELDSSGTLIQSNIKIMSIEEAQKDSEKAIIYTYEAETSKMIVNIEYQEKDILVCTYDDTVDIINQEQNTQILPIDDKITFVSATLKNSIAYITEETEGMFNLKSTLNILNTQNNTINTYNFEEVAKEVYTYGNIIAINIGTEIYFIDTNGMLIKKYTSNQEITSTQISENIAILIYKDRIEVINL